MDSSENNNTNNNDNIKIGDYIIIQRQKYTKLHKFGNVDSTAMLGNDKIELKNSECQPYFTTFKMIPKSGKEKRLNTLEPCTYETNNVMDMLNVTESGQDNRNIIDDGDSQYLKPKEIAKLRESCQSSSEIVGHLIGNSKTFASKTEYAQEKYLTKKVKKYFEYLQIKKPTIRLIAEIMYRQDPEKICGLRIDTISQIISYSGISSTGNYLLYESGTNGLLPSTLLNSIGGNTTGQLVHMHPGNVPQKLALLAMNYESEQLERCISVNIYSVLRNYYQSREIAVNVCVKRKLNEDNDNKVVADGDDKNENVDKIENGSLIINNEHCSNVIDNNNDEHLFNQPKKIQKLDNNAVEENDTINLTNLESIKTDENVITDDTGLDVKNPKKLKWMYDNEKACELLKDKMDGLIIASKEHPSNILKALLPFVKPSRPVVIYNSSQEVLMELYVEMKSIGEVTNLRLTSNWMRMYQVLPDRTHPMVNRNANSGFLLYGYTVR